MKKHLEPIPNQELSGAKFTLQGKTVGVCSSYKKGGQPPYNLSAAHLQFIGIFPPSHYKLQYHFRPTVGLKGNFPPPNYKHSYELPNQELSVLYGGPTLNYGRQLSLYVPYILRVNMTGDLAHLQLSDL